MVTWLRDRRQINLVYGGTEISADLVSANYSVITS